jgi:hypothetical protein
MLIAGKSVDGLSPEQKIDALQKLPSAIGDKTTFVGQYNIQHKPESMSLAFANKAWEAYSLYQQTNDSTHLEDGCSFFLKAAEQAQIENVPTHQAQCLNNGAQMLRVLRRPEQAIDVFRQSIALALNTDAPFLANSYMGNLQRSFFESDTYDDPRVEELRRQIFEAHGHNRGEANDNSAYRIGQNEAGFSSTHKIGSDYVSECVCLMLRNPKTNRTMLAHIDAMTTPESISACIANVSVQGDNTTLQCRILGAARRSEEIKNNQKDIKNLEKTITCLGDFNVDILSAQIFGEEQPQCVVIDPIDFEITQAYPAKSLQNTDLAESLILVEIGERPLRTAFDFDVSNASNPVFLSGYPVSRINNLATKTVKQLYEKYEDPESPSLQAYDVERAVILRNTYKQSLDALYQAVDQKVLSLGTVHGEDLSRGAKDVLKKCPLYAGENARKANQEIYNIIDNDLFVQGEGGIKISDAALERLRNFKSAPAPSWTTIEYKNESGGR